MPWYCLEFGGDIVYFREAAEPIAELTIEQQRALNAKHFNKYVFDSYISGTMSGDTLQ